MEKEEGAAKGIRDEFRESERRRWRAQEEEDGRETNERGRKGEKQTECRYIYTCSLQRAHMQRGV